MTDRKKQTSMRFRPETLDKLDDLAADMGMSRTAVVDRLICNQWNGTPKPAPAERTIPYPDPFNAHLVMLDKAAALGSPVARFKAAGCNVRDTFEMACRAMESVVGTGFSDADALTLTKMIMTEARRLSDEEVDYGSMIR